MTKKRKKKTMAPYWKPSLCSNTKCHLRPDTIPGGLCILTNLRNVSSRVIALSGFNQLNLVESLPITLWRQPVSFSYYQNLNVCPKATSGQLNELYYWPILKVLRFPIAENKTLTDGGPPVPFSDGGGGRLRCCTRESTSSQCCVSERARREACKKTMRREKRSGQMRMSLMSWFPCQA